MSVRSGVKGVGAGRPGTRSGHERDTLTTNYVTHLIPGVELGLGQQILSHDLRSGGVVGE